MRGGGGVGARGRGCRVPSSGLGFTRAGGARVQKAERERGKKAEEGEEGARQSRRRKRRVCGSAKPATAWVKLGLEYPWSTVTQPQGPTGRGDVSVRPKPLDLEERVLLPLFFLSEKVLTPLVCVPPASYPAPPTRSLRSLPQDSHICKLLIIYTLPVIEIPKRENFGCGNTSRCRNPHRAPVLGVKHDGRWN